MDEHSHDAAGVAALRAGDEDTFAHLLDRYDAPLRRLARSFVSSSATADEVVQDSWLAVIEGIDRFEQRSSLKTWIYRILMNKAHTCGARDKRSVVFSAVAHDTDGLGTAFPPDRFLPPGHPTWPGHWETEPSAWESLPQQELEAHETLERVRAAIGELPTVHRLVITLRDLEECTSAEVCQLLDLNPAAVETELCRRRARSEEARCRTSRSPAWR